MLCSWIQAHEAGKVSSFGGAFLRPAVIDVVIPAYRVAGHVAGVIARVPPVVRHIIVVDDASPDDLQEVLGQLPDPRLIVLRHPVNRGVGGAMKTGFAKALELGADMIVKLDGDGQMDPSLLTSFTDPICQGIADVAKGNRFDDLAFIRTMPAVRRMGNLALSFLVKLASGYWHLFDPCNGYLAVRSAVLRRVDFARLDDRYFFEISLLCELYFARAVLADIPMVPVYAGEPSSLSPLRSIGHFTPRLLGRFLYRGMTTYFLRDLNMVSLFLVLGLPAVLLGIASSAFGWHVTGVLAIIVGLQFLGQAAVLDVGNEPMRRGAVVSSGRRVGTAPRERVARRGGPGEAQRPADRGPGERVPQSGRRTRSRYRWSR